MAYGATPEYDGTPVKEATAEKVYTFSGWTPEVVAVVCDATYTAVFTETAKEYTITWIIEGAEETVSVAYGATPEYDGTPVKEATVEKVYTFSGWTPEVVAVVGDATYTAVFAETARTYEVSIQYDGGEAEVEEYAYGEEVTLTAKTIEGKSFVKWIINGEEDTTASKTIVVNGDVTVVAVYQENSSNAEPASGCFGSVSGVAITALLGVAAVALFRRKEQD